MNLTHITADGAQQIGQIAAAYLASRNVPVTVHSDRLVAADGRTFGLHNLTSQCVALPVDRWHDVIAQHLGALLAMFPGDAPPALTAEQLRASTYLRLAPDIEPAMASAYTYATPLGRGTLRSLLAYRDGDMVRWLRDEDVALVGEDELRAIGRANLLAEPYDRLTEVVDGTPVTEITGASGFIASLALVLGDLVDDPTGDYLFMVPTRRSLTFMPFDSTLDPQAITEYAMEQYTLGPAPVCPLVHVWSGGRIIR